MDHFYFNIPTISRSETHPECHGGARFFCPNGFALKQVENVKFKTLLSTIRFPVWVDFVVEIWEFGKYFLAWIGRTDTQHDTVTLCY